MNKKIPLQSRLLPVIFVWLGVLFSYTVQADSVDARCDIYSKGEDHASASIPCVFSQRQGYITITRSDGITHDLSPQDDAIGHYKETNGSDAYRQSGLGEDGLIFRLSNESVYIYWDTAGLPGTAADNYTAPYSTANFDATARLRCSLHGPLTKDGSDCAAGINRGPLAGQAVITIMRPDGVERILQFDGVHVSTVGEGKLQAELKSGVWNITIDSGESYQVPVEMIEGG